ncbi:MAG: phosphatase, partial [Gammaproteobacteria bacterium]|nr:phosphatase [Gammaproteobacteria bacterium]
KPHDILILATSIQLLASEHRFEKWSNFPNERAKILSLLNQLNSTVLVISGDRHRGGIYKSGKIVELTASALNKGIPPIPETDTLLQGKTHTVNNYGIVEFSNSYLSLFLKDENMNILESMKISLK